MNAIEFIQFLGHSSIYEPLDNFLSQKNIKWRPKAARKLDTTHFINGNGLVLTFEFKDDLVDDKVDIKSDGDYIFNHFAIHFVAEDKKNGEYCGPMLFDLAKGDSRADVQKKLGVKPTRILEWGDNYFVDDLVWTVSCKKSGFLEYVMLDLPSDGFRKYGVCP
jgi:hypothetical protein